MRSALSCAAALLLFGNLAQAADSTQLAQTGGFLLGNAQRCGVPAERVARAGSVIHEMISAASYDTREAAVADTRFAEIFLASAFPDRDRAVLIPSCEVVTQQFDRIERHHEEAGVRRGMRPADPIFKDAH